MNFVEVNGTALRYDLLGSGALVGGGDMHRRLEPALHGSGSHLNQFMCRRDK
jgi:hypothetical protein